jgi:hypothetical protein
LGARLRLPVWISNREPLRFGDGQTNSHNPNGHSFTGEVEHLVRFTPFPASKLTAMKNALRDAAGDGLSNYLRGRPLKACP